MYREMAVEMTEREIRTCMSILFEGSVILEIRRNTIQNFIDITFKLMGDTKEETYRVSLLSDSIDGLSDGVRLRGDGLYIYEQFMIAKGYSDYWKDNIFISQ